MLPQLSYRGRVLIVNNLVASTLWHSLSEGIQRAAVDFFWSGLHWLRSAILYLPMQEGQGLVDIAARITAFRLQTVYKDFFTGLACHGWIPFYQSVVQAWQVFTSHRKAVMTPGMWLFEEPLFGNNFISSQVLVSVSLRSRLREAGCVKLGHLMKTSIPHLADRINIRSNRLLLRLVEEVCASLLDVLRAFAEV